MTAVTIGDLSQSFALRQRNTALKEQMGRLTTELATGQVADPREVLAGNQSYLADLERKRSLLGGYAVTTAEAAQFADAMQSALGRVSDVGNTLSASLIASGTNLVGLTAQETAAEARNALSAMMGSLTSDVGGRYLFSGTASDQPTLASPNDLLTALGTALAGATTPAAMMAAAQLWFDDPAGFDAVIYQGAAGPLGPFALSENETASLAVTGTDPALKDMIRLTALAGLADDPAFGLDLTDQSALFKATGTDMLGANDQITGLQARIGFVESRIAENTTRNAAELISLERARTALLEVDPFEAATRLEDVQFQLQSLYSVTVRSAQLSLVNFL